MPQQLDSMTIHRRMVIYPLHAFVDGGISVDVLQLNLLRPLEGA